MGKKKTAQNILQAVNLLVGARGFEPPTTCTPCKYATRLRYAPNCSIIAASWFKLKRAASSMVLLQVQELADFTQFTAHLRIATDGASLPSSLALDVGTWSSNRTCCMSRPLCITSTKFYRTGRYADSATTRGQARLPVRTGAIPANHHRSVWTSGRRTDGSFTQRRTVTMLQQAADTDSAILDLACNRIRPAPARLDLVRTQNRRYLDLMRLFVALGGSPY